MEPHPDAKSDAKSAKSDAKSAKSHAQSVNYDSGALVELEIEGTQYRLDSGKHGTALCVSTRQPGSWDWSFVTEARWDGRDLRARALDRPVLKELARALAEAVETLD